MKRKVKSSESKAIAILSEEVLPLLRRSRPRPFCLFLCSLPSPVLSFSENHNAVSRGLMIQFKENLYPIHPSIFYEKVSVERSRKHTPHRVSRIESLTPRLVAFAEPFAMLEVYVKSECASRGLQRAAPVLVVHAAKLALIWMRGR